MKYSYIFFIFSSVVYANNNDFIPTKETNRVLSCININEDLDRLQCFDELFANKKNSKENSENLTTNISLYGIELENLQACSLLTKMSERLLCFDTVGARIKLKNTVISTDNKTEENTNKSNNLRKKSELTEAPQNNNNKKIFNEPKSPPSLITQGWQLVAQADRGPFVITPYRPTYVLPFSYTHRTNDEPFSELSPGSSSDNIEIKFQISFKTKIWPNFLSPKGDLWFAYTQKSYWQAYNSSASAIFRETNYEPEIIYSYKTNIGFGAVSSRLLMLSLNHQSNGRGPALSRSWNRIIASAFFDVDDDFTISTSLWQRINGSGQDDNPDIEDFVGRAELSAYWKRGKNNYTVMIRNNLNENNRGSIQIDWSRKNTWLPIKPYIQYFYGYGDSLIDYNIRSNRLSVGFLLTDWF